MDKTRLMELAGMQLNEMDRGPQAVEVLTTIISEYEDIQNNDVKDILKDLRVLINDLEA